MIEAIETELSKTTEASKTQTYFREPTEFSPIHRDLRDPEVQGKIITMVIGLVDENAKGSSVTGFHDALRRAEEMYNMKVTYRVPPSKKMSNFGSPLVKIAVDTLADRINDVHFAMPEGPAQVVAGNEKSDLEREVARLGQRALAHVLDFYYDKEIVHRNTFKTGFKAGDGWTKQTWEFDVEVNVVEQTVEDPIFGPVTIENEVPTILELGPKMTWIDPKYVHFPEDHPDPLNAPWFVHEEYYRPEDVRRKIVMGEWAEETIPEEPTESKEVNVGDDSQKRAAAHISEGRDVFKYKKIYTAYMKWKSPKDKWEHNWIFVVNVTDRKLLKGVRNKMGEIPFAKYTPFPIEGQPRGESLAISLEQLWKYENTVFNYVADTATLSTRPGGAYRPSEYLTRRNMQTTFGEYFPDRDPQNAIKNFEVPDVKPGILDTLKLLFKFAQDLTGINDMVLGQFAQGVERPTARGTASLLGQISIKFESINKNIQAGLRRAYYQMFWMMVEYGGDAYFARLLDESGIASYFEQEQAKSLNLTQGLFLSTLKSMKWDIVIPGNTISADKGIKQRKMLQLFQILLPLLQGQPDKLAKLINTLIKTFEVRELENIGEDLVTSVTQQQVQQPTLNLEGRPVVDETELANL